MKTKSILGWVASALVSLVFVGAGTLKMVRAPEMVAIFGNFHLPIWFMYVTAAVEISLGVGLFFRRHRIGLLSAAGLSATMLVGSGFHLVYDPAVKAIPALILMAVCAALAYTRRGLLKREA